MSCLVFFDDCVSAVFSDPFFDGSELFTRRSCAATSDGVRICSQVPGVSAGVGAMTVAHELAHMLQGQAPWESYGDQVRLNTYFSLMAGTVEERDERRSYHLDAYAKMRLGWLRPRIVTTRTTGCFALLAAEQRPVVPVRRRDRAGPDPYPLNRGLLIYDPRRGWRDFLLLEHRNPAANYDANPWAEPLWSGLPDVGLAIWRASLDPSGNLTTVRTVFGGVDAGLYLLPPGASPGTIGMPGVPASFQGLWSRANGVAQPLWPRNPPKPFAPSGAKIEVVSSRVGRDVIVVSLGGAECDETRAPAYSRSRVGVAVPALDDGPCRTVRGGALVCGWRTSHWIARRRVDAALAPGALRRVRWSITPRVLLPGGIRVVEQLGGGLTAKLRRGARRRAVLRFPRPLPPGQTVVLRYNLRVSPRAPFGRVGVRIRLAVGGRLHRLLVPALVLRRPRVSPEVFGAAVAPTEPTPPLLPGLVTAET